MRDAFTIGHSNQDLDSLLGLLRQHKLDVVADVRSEPFSRYSAHFNGPALEPVLEGRGVRYVFLGRELGGLPDQPFFYDAKGHVLYWKLARSDLFLNGLGRIEGLISAGRVAIMCSEEDPAGCHRRLLVGRVLTERGVQIRHIRGDGRVQGEGEFPDILGMCQPALFGDTSEEAEWKSIRSVSPRRQPRSSSAS